MSETEKFLSDSSEKSTSENKAKDHKHKLSIEGTVSFKSEGKQERSLFVEAYTKSGDIFISSHEQSSFKGVMLNGTWYEPFKTARLYKY